MEKIIKVAIYSSIIPSTNFIENLISELANNVKIKVLLFGKKSSEFHSYSNKNIKTYITPRNKIFLLFKVFFWFLQLLKNKPSNFFKIIRYYKIVIKNDTVPFFYWWGKVLPVIINLPDIFHIQWAKSLSFWFFLQDEFDVKIILSLRGTHINYSPIIDEKLANEYRSFFPRVSHFHSVSNAIGEKALSFGANENKMEDYFNYLTGLNYKPSKKRNLVNQIYILRNKKALVFFDIGAPPNKKNSSCYQCGPLSFEFFSNDNKIITNCGYGNQISKKMEMISRFTSAQSTLSLNDTSVIKFERNSLINNAFGISIKNSFKILNFKKEETMDSLFVSASHNAYENKFGYIHNRLIKINKKNNDLYGVDTLLRTKEVNLINKYNIRFHLYPGIKAVQTIGGSTILMQTQKNKSLIFSTNGEHLMLEKSIFLARNKIINNFCINISGTVNKQDKKITWEIKRNI